MTRKGCLLAAALHLLGGLLILSMFALFAGRFLVVDDPPAQADAIVVLGGELNPSRSSHAVQLYEDGRASVVVFSGGQYKDLGIACSSAQISLQAARELGLPEGVAVIAPEAQSTYDEAVNLRRLVQEHGWRSLILVTDAFHTRRARRTFRTVMPGVTICVSPAPNSDYDPARWWRSERGLISVFNELIKLGFYWARYGIVPFGR